MSRLQGNPTPGLEAAVGPTACSEALSEVLVPGQAMAAGPSPKGNIKNTPVKTVLQNGAQL